MITSCDMTDAELVDALEGKRAAVVHFSHHSNMRKGVTFPGDIINAIESKNDWSLCCHVVWPGHEMDLVGSVGLIFGVTSTSQVLRVRNADAGSCELPNGSVESLGVPLSKESFDDTFSPAGAYNEWRVRGADPVGIFVAVPADIYVQKYIVRGEAEHRWEGIGKDPISLDEVASKFPDQDIYTMGPNGLQLLRGK
jgi:hypothetical protein